MNSLMHHIMVVDDEIFLTDMISKALKGNYQITALNCGADVLSSVKEIQPDLILLDIMLPDVSGYDICKQIKKDITIQQIPVIFISSLTSFIDKTKAFEVGAVDYIIKPIEIPELKMRINTHLTISQLQRKMEEIIQRRTDELEKSNSALHAMLKHRETEMRAIEELLLVRMKKHIIPYLNKIEKATYLKVAFFIIL